jgi:imidazoleglycerol-phosphate dehydratase
MTAIVRETRETQVRVEIARGTGTARVETGVAFLDHMLATLARYSALDLAVQARGDLAHHLIEDVAIAVGTAVRGLADRPIARYGNRVIPMDDALVHVSLDLGGRFYYRGPLPSRLYDHWFRSFGEHARATIHVHALRGEDRHHVIEAAFKALGLALRDALAEQGAVFSVKGVVEWTSR